MSNVKVLKCVLTLSVLVGMFLAMEQYPGSAGSAFGIWIALFLLVLIAAIVVARGVRSRKQAILPIIIVSLAAMQVHMLIWVQATFLYFLATFLACIAAVCTGIVSLIWLALRLMRERELKGPAILACITFLFITVAIGGLLLTGLQRQRNERPGSILGKAIARYHKDKGYYPPELSALRGTYLNKIPKWRCGLASFNYIYWVDTWSTAEEANLKFPGGPGTGVFYVFEEDCWFGSTVP